jgi:hypothetical protein
MCRRRPIKIHENLTIEIKLIKIIDQSLKELRNKKLPLVKALWGNSRIEEETWKRELEMRKKYPALFLGTGENFYIERVSS